MARIFCVHASSEKFHVRRPILPRSTREEKTQKRWDCDDEHEQIRSDWSRQQCRLVVRESFGSTPSEGSVVWYRRGSRIRTKTRPVPFVAEGEASKQLSNENTCPRTYDAHVSYTICSLRWLKKACKMRHLLVALWYLARNFQGYFESWLGSDLRLVYRIVLL
jgi:hypothetical protein